MGPKLKEDPGEWRKFAGALLAAMWIVLAWLSHRNGSIAPRALEIAAVATVVVLAAAALRPRWLRPMYLVLMTVGFHIGQIVGRLLLAAAFMLIVVPLGVALRLAGKDLLRLKKGAADSGYWQPARRDSPLERQF